MHNLEWDNLRYVLLVARYGSIAETARRLGVNRTTVLRRIRAYQEQLQVKLFEPSANGYILSPEANKLLQAAEQMEDIMASLDRQLLENETGLKGELRVTTTDSLALNLLGPHIATFSKLHPDIELELMVTNHHLSLSRRDADISIRPTNKPPAHLVGEKIGDLPFAVYASKDYIKNASDKHYRQHDWVGVDEILLDSPPGRWQQQVLQDKQFSFRADSFVSLQVAAENSMGYAHLPKLLGESSQNLAQVKLDLPEVSSGIWMLTHRDVRQVARVNAFIQHLSIGMAS